MLVTSFLKSKKDLIHNPKIRLSNSYVAEHLTKDLALSRTKIQKPPKRYSNLLEA